MNNSNKKSTNTVDPLTEFLTMLMDDFIKLVTKLLHLFIEKVAEKISNKGKRKLILEEFIFDNTTTTNISALGYSVSHSKDMLFSDVPFQRHTWVLGGTGFGKSNLFSLLMENRTMINSPLVYIDPKGSRTEINQFRNLLKFYGKDVLIFSELYPGEISFNPLSDLDDTMRTQIIMRSLEWSEGEARYYKDQSQRALLRTIYDLKKEKIIISIPNIYRHLCEHRDEKETSGLIAQLELIISSPFGSLLEDNGSSVNMRSLRKAKKSLYVGLSTQGYGSVAKTIGKLIINDIQMTSHIVGIEADDSHVSMENFYSVFIDEAGSVLYPEFIDFLNKNRSSGFHTYIAMQTPADAMAIGPNFKDHLMELCSNLIILKQSNNTYATEISETIGTRKTIKRTNVTVDQIQDEKGSEREAREYYVSPQVIKDLGVGQCVVVTKAPSTLNFLNLRDLRMSEAFAYKSKAKTTSELTIEDVKKDKILNSDEIFDLNKRLIKPITKELEFKD